MLTPGGIEQFIYPDAAELSQAAAHYILRLLNEAVAAQGYCTLMLSGGSTPGAIYAHLKQADLASKLNWKHVHLFWGDERCVSPDHPWSNFRLAWEAWLSQAPVPAENIHRIRGELNPQQAAWDYEQEMRGFFAGLIPPSHTAPQGEKLAWPSFDLILLGMGADGHVASLFPGDPALEERQRWALAVEHLQPPPPLGWRVTVTLPLINAARRVMFVVSGKEKAWMVRQALEADSGTGTLPVQRVRPQAGQVVWFLDQAASKAET